MNGVGASMVVRNFGRFRRKLKKYDADRRIAGELAVRVELYRLRKKMQKELRGGGIAGKKFTPLRTISKAKPSSRRKVLGGLSKGVRYQMRQAANGKLFSLGFFGDVGAKSWRGIAKKHQEGFEVSTSDPLLWTTLRGFYAWVGSKHQKDGKFTKLRRRFFLRKSTTKLKTPARPIIEPFWDANERNSRINIVNNFNRKMRGERI